MQRSSFRSIMSHAMSTCYYNNELNQIDEHDIDFMMSQSIRFQSPGFNWIHVNVWHYDAIHVNVIHQTSNLYMNPNRIKMKTRWNDGDVDAQQVVLHEVPKWRTSGGHLINGRKRWTSQWVPLFSSWLYGCIKRCWKKERDFKFCCTIWDRCLHWHWKLECSESTKYHRNKTAQR